MVLAIRSAGRCRPTSVGPCPECSDPAPVPSGTATHLCPDAGRREPGLTLCVASIGGSHLVSDRRGARSVALYVGENEPVTPFVPSGPFSATWTGDLELAMWNKVTFSAEGTGALQLTVGGTLVLDITGPDLSGTTGTIRLNRGRNHLVATYRSPTAGAAQLRLLWASREFAAEPVPPTLFSHELDQPLDDAIRLRRGRELVGTLLCTRCHGVPGAKQGMPELDCDAPDLREAGARLDRDWMAAWIADPRQLRPGAAMPRMLHGAPGEVARQAADLAAYLAGLGTPSPAPVSDPAAVARGARRFAALGCLACHAAGHDGPARVDLAGVSTKWKPAALVQFLRHPNAHYAWIGMPDFGLGDDEAGDLAAFLRAGAPGPAGVATAGNADRGAALAAATGCMNCHRLPGSGHLAAAPLAELAHKTRLGCLASDGGTRGAAPDFALPAPDLEALRAFIAMDGGSGFPSLRVRCLPEFAERRIAALDCAACHARDGREAVLTDRAEAAAALLASYPGAPAESAIGAGIPSLTGAGDKLRPEWMADFIAGRCHYRPRPWLAQHMPAFPTGAELLAQGLAMQAGHPPTTRAVQDAEPVERDLGRRLLGQEHGFACVACHAVGAQAAVTNSDAPGINLGHACQRLRPEWFQRWMRWPARVDPATRMPRFAGEDGTTQLLDVLGGRADDQFAAIWRYLQTAGSAQQ